MSVAHDFRRSIPELATDALSQLAQLFRKEMQLARTEVSEKASQAIGGLVMVMIGAVLLIPALVILLLAAVTALTENGVAGPWASLIVGGGALAIGAILAMVGISRLKAENLTPTRTIEQLQRDAAVAKEQVR
jgi:hypothetical protein